MAADDAAVVVTLRANLKDYEAALKSAVRATERAAKAAEGAIANVGKKGGAGQVIEANFAKSSAAIANDARVLQFQLNDIFSGIASGQGIRAVQQQLGQISQLLQGTTLLGAARTLGAGLFAMVNPINLAVVAFGVLATVAASYFSTSEKEAKKATDALKKQADELDRLAEKYGALFPELKRAAQAQRELLDEAEKAIAVQKALAAAYEDTTKVVEDLQPSIVELISTILDSGAATDGIADLQEQFSELAEAIDEHRASADDAKAVIDALNKIIQTQGGRVAELATAIRNELVAALAELERASESAGTTLRNALDFQFPGAGGALDLTPLIRARQQLELLSDAAEFIKREEGFVSRAMFDVNAFRVGFGSDTFVDEMGRVQQVTRDTVVTLQQANADLARRIPEFQKTITDAIGADLWESLSEQQQAALTSIAYNFGRLPAKVVAALKAGDQGQVAKAISDLAGNPERRAREAAPFGGAPKATSQEKALADLKDWNVETQRRIELEGQVAEINARVGLTETQRQAQIEGLRIAEEELNRLRKAGVEVTAEMEAGIRSLAQAQADASARSQEALDAQKALVDEQKKSAAELARLQQQLAGLLSSALSGFTRDLMAGRDAGEAFGNMLRNLAGQIADMVIQLLVIKPLMNALFPGAGTIGGGLFEAGGTVGLSGKRDGRQFSPMLWAGAPRYAAGGMVGLRPGEMPIIAHRGEIVVPNARRLAGVGQAADNRQRTVNVNVTAHPSPLLELRIEKRSIAAEESAIARGPAIARANSMRFGVP